MAALVRRIVLVLGALTLATGCVRQYRPPALDEPHANVQLRSVHHAVLGPELREQMLIDGEPVSVNEEGDQVRTTTVRVRPLATTYEIHTRYFHSVTRWVTETWWPMTSFYCGSNGFGPTYCTSQWPQTRTVPVTVRVSDGGCHARYEHRSPVPGAVYLVQYELIADGICQVTCQRLLQGEDGRLLATSCGLDEPPTRPTSGGESPGPGPTDAR